MLVFRSLLLVLCCPATAQDVAVDLVDPIFEDGVLTTTKGGVITAPNLRLQARSLSYTHKEDRHTICAEGDLMLEYGCYVFVGTSLNYDFVTQEGCLHGGRGTMGDWYVGGRCLALQADGTIIVQDGFLTTCESTRNEWQFQAKSLELHQNGLIRARKIGLSLLDTPIFWFPSLETRLDRLRSSPLQTRIRYGGPTGSVLGLRYRFLDKGAFTAHARLEYFFNRGPGAGVETTYCPARQCTRLKTQSYLARDRTFAKTEQKKETALPCSSPNPKNQWRYRLAGCYFDRWDNTSASISYDWLSDPLMPTDFQSDHFNLETAHRSHATLRHATQNLVSQVWATPRLNTFQTINQRLPEARLQFLTRELGCSGVLLENRLNAGYMNFVFARETSDASGVARGFHAQRLELNPTLYRPFCLGALTAQPELSLIAIGYSNRHGRSPGEHQGSLLLVGHAALETQIRMHKWTGCHKHVIEPYLRWDYYTKPTTPAAAYKTADTALLPNGHYVFSYEDGYTKLNQCRFGLRNLIYRRHPSTIQQQLALDLYAFAFLHNPNIPGTIPRLYTSLRWSPTCWLTATLNGAWNVVHHQPDHFYTRLRWTVSEDAAMSLEYRYRSQYAWRKANATSFFPDTLHPESILENSGLSYRHNTLLTHAFLRIDPNVSVAWDSRHSWRRRIGKLREDNYNEWRVSLQVLLPCRWILKCYYEKNQFNHTWDLGFTLGPPCPNSSPW